MMNVTVRSLNDRSSTISMNMHIKEATGTAHTHHMLHGSKQCKHCWVEPRVTAELTLSEMKNRDGQMSKQKTAFVSAGLRDRKWEAERGRSLRSRCDSKGKTQTFVRKQSSVRLESPADPRRSDGAGQAAHFKARRWLEGGTFWGSWWNATHGACSGRLMKRPETSHPIGEEVRGVRSHL